MALVELTYFRPGQNYVTDGSLQVKKNLYNISKGQIATVKRKSGEGERSGNNEWSMAQREDS